MGKLALAKKNPNKKQTKKKNPNAGPYINVTPSHYCPSLAPTLAILLFDLHRQHQVKQTPFKLILANKIKNSCTNVFYFSVFVLVINLFLWFLI